VDDSSKILNETPPEGKKKKMDKKDKQTGKVNEASISKDDSKSIHEVVGGVKIQDRKIGSGTEATKGSTVRMRYTGKLDDGSVFDSNQKGKPVSTRMESLATPFYVLCSSNSPSAMVMLSRDGMWVLQV
jgi:FK506-binding nuclear protein